MHAVTGALCGSWFWAEVGAPAQAPSFSIRALLCAHGRLPGHPCSPRPGCGDSVHLSGALGTQRWGPPVLPRAQTPRTRVWAVGLSKWVPVTLSRRRPCAQSAGPGLSPRLYDTIKSSVTWPLQGRWKTQAPSPEPSEVATPTSMGSGLRLLQPCLHSSSPHSGPASGGEQLSCLPSSGLSARSGRP